MPTDRDTYIEDSYDRMENLLARAKELRAASASGYCCDVDPGGGRPALCRFGAHLCDESGCPLNETLDASDFYAMAREVFDSICAAEETGSAASSDEAEVRTLE